MENAKPLSAIPTQVRRDPRQAPRLTAEQVAKLAPQEKTAAHVAIHVQALRMVETEVAQAMLDAVQNGVALEGRPHARVAVEDLVPLVISVDSAYLPDAISEKWQRRDQTIGFVLRDRATLAKELLAMRLPQGAKVGSGSREERRAAAARMDKKPWALLGEQLGKRLRDGNNVEIKDAHYAVVLGDQVLGSVFPFRFNAAETAEALAEVKAVKDAAAAELAAESHAPAPEAPVLPTVEAPSGHVPAPEAAVFPSDDKTDE